MSRNMAHTTQCAEIFENGDRCPEPTFGGDRCTVHGPYFREACRLNRVKAAAEKTEETDGQKADFSHTRTKRIG